MVIVNDSDFPRLRQDGYVVKSEPDERYNCVAWAAGENHRWWEPCDGRYWPEKAPRDYTIDALAQAYAAHGFIECQSVDYEAGVQKIALYGLDDGEYLHAARQLKNGQWTSKLGADEDICHASPEAVAYGTYGDVVKIMMRAYPDAIVLGDD